MKTSAEMKLDWLQAMEEISQPPPTVVEDDKQRRDQVAHPLNVSDVQMLPDVGHHHISQLFQVLLGEIPEVSVTPLHILVDTMQIQREQVEQFVLRTGRLAR